MKTILILIFSISLIHGQSKKEQIIALNSKIDSLKNENYDYSLKISELRKKYDDLANSNSQLLDEKKSLISKNDSILKNLKKLVEDVKLLKEEANNKCEKAAHLEEISDSKSLFNLKNCFNSPKTQTKYIKHFLFSIVSENILNNKKNIDLSKEQVLELLKFHFEENEKFYNFYDDIDLNEVYKEIKDSDYNTTMASLNNIVYKMNETFSLSIQKINSNLYQVNTGFGTASSNSFTLIQKNEKGILNLLNPYYLNEIEKKLILKLKIYVYSVYQVHGTSKERLFGKDYLMFKFAKADDPACCPSYTVAIRYSDDISIENLYFRDNSNNSMWMKL